MKKNKKIFLIMSIVGIISIIIGTTVYLTYKNKIINEEKNSEKNRKRLYELLKETDFKIEKDYIQSIEEFEYNEKNNLYHIIFKNITKTTFDVIFNNELSPKIGKGEINENKIIIYFNDQYFFEPNFGIKKKLFINIKKWIKTKSQIISDFSEVLIFEFNNENYYSYFIEKKINKKIKQTILNSIYLLNNVQDLIKDIKKYNITFDEINEKTKLKDLSKDLFNEFDSEGYILKSSWNPISFKKWKNIEKFLEELIQIKNEVINLILTKNINIDIKKSYIKKLITLLIKKEIVFSKLPNNYNSVIFNKKDFSIDENEQIILNKNVETNFIKLQQIRSLINYFIKEKTNIEILILKIKIEKKLEEKGFVYKIINKLYNKEINISNLPNSKTIEFKETDFEKNFLGENLILSPYIKTNLEKLKSINKLIIYIEEKKEEIEIFLLIKEIQKLLVEKHAQYTIKKLKEGKLNFENFPNKSDNVSFNKDDFVIEENIIILSEQIKTNKKNLQSILKFLHYINKRKVKQYIDEKYIEEKLEDEKINKIMVELYKENIYINDLIINDGDKLYFDKNNFESIINSNDNNEEITTLKFKLNQNLHSLKLKEIKKLVNYIEEFKENMLLIIEISKRINKIEKVTFLHIKKTLKFIIENNNLFNHFMERFSKENFKNLKNNYFYIRTNQTITISQEIKSNIEKLNVTFNFLNWFLPIPYNEIETSISLNEYGNLFISYIEEKLEISDLKEKIKNEYDEYWNFNSFNSDGTLSIERPESIHSIMALYVFLNKCENEIIQLKIEEINSLLIEEENKLLFYIRQIMNNSINIMNINGYEEKFNTIKDTFNEMGNLKNSQKNNYPYLKTAYEFLVLLKKNLQT